MIFPALSIAIPRIAMTVKMLRSSILDQMGQDYIRTAYSRGHDRDGVLWGHALRNALIPCDYLYCCVHGGDGGGQHHRLSRCFPFRVSDGCCWRRSPTAISPVVQAIVVILTLWVVVVNFIADVLYQYIDPRIRLN